MNGTVQIKTIHSEKLNREVTLSVYLPKSYDGVRKFPVLYMHDGHNLFERKTSSFGHIWQVDEAFSYPVRELIVVGIDAPRDERRLDELCPYENSWSKGKGDQYLSFVLETKKWVDETFCTIPDRESTGMIGSSMGGYITTYALTKWNNTFSKYGMLSSAYWIDESLLHEVKDTTIQDAKVYLDYGTNESGLAGKDDYIVSNKAMIDVLRTKDITLDVHEFVGAEHNELEWAVRLPLVIRYLFGGKK